MTLNCDETTLREFETCKVHAHTHTILQGGNQGTILHNIYTEYYTHFVYNLHIPYIVQNSLLQN